MSGLAATGKTTVYALDPIGCIANALARIYIDDFDDRDVKGEVNDQLFRI